MHKKIKIIFSGSSEFSAQHLKFLIKNNIKIIAVLTPPNKPFGRGKKIVENPVYKISKKYNIIIFNPTNLKSEDIYINLKKMKADMMIVVSYGLIFPKKILDIFPLGCINLHTSILPRWRGPSPIQSAILHGDNKTGVTTIYMDKGMDSGPIIHTIECNIKKKMTSLELNNKLIKIGKKCLLYSLKKIFIQKNICTIQNIKNVTYTKKIKKQDAKIKWNKTAIEIERVIRAYNPWPVAYFNYKNINIKVWKSSIEKKNYIGASIGEICCSDKIGLKIQTKNFCIRIEKIQFPGKKIINFYDFLNSKKEFFIIGSIIV